MLSRSTTNGLNDREYNPVKVGAAFFATTILDQLRILRDNSITKLGQLYIYNRYFYYDGVLGDNRSKFDLLATDIENGWKQCDNFEILFDYDDCDLMYQLKTILQLIKCHSVEISMHKFMVYVAQMFQFAILSFKSKHEQLVQNYIVYYK